MEFQVIFTASRRCTIELLHEGAYFTDQEYEIWVDGTMVMTSNKVVQTINGLKPDTCYQVEVRMGEKRAVKEVKTCYEYVTLNVKDFGARGDKVHDDTVCIQAAILSCPKNSRVYLPKGVYKVSSLFLKSDMTLDFGEGAGEISDSTWAC